MSGRHLPPTALAVLPLLLCAHGLGGCAPPAPEAPAPDVLDAIVLPTFEPRVRARIEELSARLEASREQAAGRQPGDGELEALAEMFLGARGRMRDVPLAEVRAIGDGALEPLVAMNADESLSGELRNAALHLAFAVGTPAALEAVVGVLETAREPWRRRYAAWLLGQTDDDRVLLRMVLVLRYEKDGETVVWLAEALARHGNYSGLPGLERIASGGGPASELARTKQGELLAEAALGLPDIAALEALWDSADSHDRLDPEPSDALRLAAWIELGELSSERFQLRGVDDARFVLCRTGPWGARLVSEALVDEDPYVRLHAAQVLERMGERALPVADHLLALLPDSLSGPAAAEALGAIGARQALPHLRAALRPHRPHELRMGAAHGLGSLGEEAAAPDLRALVEAEDTPDDLRLAAAAALARCGDGERALPVLVAGMQDEYGDPQGCEVALEHWLEERAGKALEGSVELLERWRALEGPPPLLRTRDDTRTRLEERASLLREALLQP